MDDNRAQLGSPTSAARVPTPSTPTLRCAVYTRKSSEEGLDQAFNSLDAQREAGQDFIRSQRHQGWIAVKTPYDDGGYSGGSTERPGLQRLLADIRAGRVDVVVVYKVDRFSRSLADFARLMQLFDERRVSFVSVTQQFNTTTSMGRLTLNMLLSFAQFEREVSGERIRDKIAATKRKGLWVCGRPPLGYRIAKQGDTDYGGGERVLRIVESEAELVRAIFTGYLKGGSLVSLAREFNARGHRTRMLAGEGVKRRGGRPLTPGYLYRVLTNSVYVGKITHLRSGQGQGMAGLSATGSNRRGRRDDRPGSIFDGQHQPIIDGDTWARVQAKMGEIDRSAGATEVWASTHLLKGKLRTNEGSVMSPSSVQRPVSRRKGHATPDQKRVILYYVSQKAIKQGYAMCPIKSVNAKHLDNLVRALVIDHCRAAHAADLRPLRPEVRDRVIRDVIAQVVIAPSAFTIDLDPSRIEGAMATARVASERTDVANPTELSGVVLPVQLAQPAVSSHGDLTRLTLKTNIKRLDNRRLLVSADGQELYSRATPEGRLLPHEHIRFAIGLAYVWHRELLETGDSIKSLAQRHGLSPARVHAIYALTHLNPAVVGRALRGELSMTTPLKALTDAAQSLDWSQQRV